MNKLVTSQSSEYNADQNLLLAVRWLLEGFKILKLNPFKEIK